uniref:Sentan, cilia apical structure protein n=1 Tax=Anser cygnoides TaxID=8845 RepID=A0A8B9IPA4_ANSCY
MGHGCRQAACTGQSLNPPVCCYSSCLEITNSLPSRCVAARPASPAQSTTPSVLLPPRRALQPQRGCPSALEKGSDLEKAVATAALVYNNAADPEGKLSKAETKNLLQTQFLSFIQGQENKPKYQEVISALDEETENKIDFEDFMILLVSLTLMSDLLQEIKNMKTTK